MKTFAEQKKKSAVGFTPQRASSTKHSSFSSSPEIDPFERTSPAIAHNFGQVRIQPKLTIGRPGDKYEQEADRMADKVMRMPEPRLQRQVEPEEEEEKLLQAKPLDGQITPLVQRKAEPEEEEELVSPKAQPGRTPQIASGLETRINTMRGGGQPLPDSARAFFEPRFGHDFSRVQVHTGTLAAESAQTLNARAYTVGRDIAFSPGAYAPETPSGRRLLAHELVHTIQQQNYVQKQATLAMRSLPIIQRKIIDKSDYKIPDTPYRSYFYENKKTGNIHWNFGKEQGNEIKRNQKYDPWGTGDFEIYDISKESRVYSHYDKKSGLTTVHDINICAAGFKDVGFFWDGYGIMIGYAGFKWFKLRGKQGKKVPIHGLLFKAVDSAPDADKWLSRAGSIASIIGAIK